MLQRRGFVYVVLLLAAVAALYGRFLWNPIVFDDMYFFMLDNSGHQPVSDYHFAWLQLRSLPYATLAWTKAWFGLDLIYFRLGNLLLHGAVAIALYVFLAKIYSSVLGASRHDGLSLNVIAFFAALLFVLHPVATYAAGYLVQRSIVMATLFGLLAMLAYVLGSLQNKALWLWMSVPLYYLSVFSKEHAIMLPFALAALTVLLHEDWMLKLKQRWLVFAALAAIGLIVLSISRGLLGSVYEINAPEMLRQSAVGFAWPLSVVTQCGLFFKYALLWLFPNPAWMSVDMREPFASSLMSSYLVAAACFLGWGAGAIWMLLRRGKIGLLGFALLYPWLMFMTELSSVRLQEIFVLYRSYLWSVGTFCLLPLILARVRLLMAVTVLSIIALALFGASMERLNTFSHPLLLWDDAEKLVKGRTDLPGAERIYYNRGSELIRIGKQEQAVVDLQQAVALNGNFDEAYGNLGAAYFKTGDWSNAAASFSQAIEVARRQNKNLSPRYVYGRAQSFENMGALDQARADYKASCQLAGQGCDKAGR